MSQCDSTCGAAFCWPSTWARSRRSCFDHPKERRWGLIEVDRRSARVRAWELAAHGGVSLLALPPLLRADLLPDFRRRKAAEPQPVARQRLQQPVAVQRLDVAL